MSTLNQFLKGRYRGGLGAVGIEIETETKIAYDVPGFKYWTAHTDGSLRNYGIEYVLATPLDPGSEKYIAAMSEFETFAKAIAFENSTYTSVHVHLNFVDKELTSLANFITLYVLFEGMLTRYCGPDRDGNLFCLKTRDAETLYLLYRDLLKSIESGRGQPFIKGLSASRYKYSALNVVPLTNFGSVEVRTHPGVTDVKLINRWVNILMRLYTLADTYKSPLEILEMYRKMGTKEFVNYVFDHYVKYFDEKTIDKDLFDGLIYAKTLAYAVDDWSTFGVYKEPARFVDEGVTFSADEYRRILDQIGRYTVAGTNATTNTTTDNNRTVRFQNLRTDE